MSRTLFWYIFRDLLKIFLLTSGALAGIMSFGGLLRPLTDQGLDAMQVGRVLGYFLPVMLTYSLPIAAVFATTMVYGRLAADNEITGCRAAGISHLSLALPALVLGLTVAIISLLFLCFIVPVFMLRVERVVYSNLAQLVAGQITRTQQMRFRDTEDSEGVNIFADRAYAEPQANPDEQQVVTLIGTMIMTYAPTERYAHLWRKGKERAPRVPERFYMAKQATVYITQNPGTEEVFIEARLEGGSSFSRDMAGSAQGGIAETQFGPYPVQSPIKENTKFMDIFQLDEMYLSPENSRKINTRRLALVQYEQSIAFLERVRRQLVAEGGIEFVSAINPADTYRISGPWPLHAERHGEEVVLRSLSDGRDLSFIQDDAARRLRGDAREIRIRVDPDNLAERITVTVKLIDLAVHTGDLTSYQKELSPAFGVIMPPSLLAMRDRPAEHYAALPAGPEAPETQEARTGLARAIFLLRNDIQAEKNARASFAISCLILVLVGCALGMMFRSGNFLSAFAVSAVPAIVIITLIISGQQVAANSHINDALGKGLALIWSGNLVVAAAATILLVRLQRQ